MEKYLEKFDQIITTYPYVKTLVVSLIILMMLYTFKRFLLFQVNRKKMNRSEKIVLGRKVNQAANFIIAIILFFVWFSQLQFLLVSLLAVAAALVLAFKELIMCLTGGLLIRSSRLYSSGNRIQVAGVRGFVVEKNFLTTRILELGPEKNSQQTTGDFITIPNSLLLSNYLKNESYFSGYSIKAFQFMAFDLATIDELEQALFRKAKDSCEEYLEVAKESISDFCQREGIVIPSVEPRTKIIIDEDGDFHVLVKVPVQNSKIADMEQELNRFFLHLRKAFLAKEKNLEV